MSLSFKTRKGKESDNEFMTPLSAWEDIKAFIPVNKTIWECFYGDGTSADHLRTLGFTVVSEDVDFFNSNMGDVLISNPPYSCKRKVFERLQELNKPFIMLLPVSTITKQYYQEYFADKCGVIIPKRRVHFVKNGIQTQRSWFDVLYICYKIDSVKPREMVYL